MIISVWLIDFIKNAILIRIGILIPMNMLKDLHNSDKLQFLNKKMLGHI